MPPGTELPGSQHEQGAGPRPALPGAKTTLSFWYLCNPWPGLGGPGPGTYHLMARGRGFTGTVSWVVVGRGHGLRHRLSLPWPAEETSETVQQLSRHIPTRLDDVSTLQLAARVTEAVARLSDLQGVDTATGGEGVSPDAPRPLEGRLGGTPYSSTLPRTCRLGHPTHVCSSRSSDPSVLQHSTPLP